MSRPRPKFCVGEEVRFLGNRDLGPSDKTVVTFVHRIKKGEVYEKSDGTDFSPDYDWGYWYGIDCARSDKDMVSEKNLRKLPPEQRAQWKDCAWQPKKEGVTV